MRQLLIQCQGQQPHKLHMMHACLVLFNCVNVARLQTHTYSCSGSQVVVSATSRLLYAHVMQDARGGLHRPLPPRADEDHAGHVQWLACAAQGDPHVT